MRPFRRRNLIFVPLLSALLAVGGVLRLHAEKPEKSEAAGKKEQAQEKRGTRRQAAPPAAPERPQPSKLRAPAGEEVTFLGIAAQSIDEAVRAQLDLPAGTGISVGGLLEDSPAEKAGVKEFDILTKLDDQILVSGEQFQTLVRMKKPGDEVTLTLLRATKEKTVTVKLGSRRFPATAASPRDLSFDSRARRFGTPPAWDQHSWEEHWKQFGDHFGKGLNEWMEQHGKNLEQNARRFLEENFGDPDTWEPRMKQWLEEDLPPRIETHVRKFANVHATIADNDGKIEITTKDGRKHVTATAPDGKVVFEGFCETDAERAKVPENILKKVDSVKFDVQFNGFNDSKKELKKPAVPQSVPKASGGTV